MNLRARRTCRSIILLFGLSVAAVCAQTNSPLCVWAYRLLEGSALIDDCPICGRPTIVQPMRGAFDLVLLERTGSYAIHALTNIAFEAKLGADITNRITGHGILRLDPANAIQEMTIHASINNSTNLYVFTIDTNLPAGSLVWPTLSVSLIETQYASFTQVFHMDLLAAPLREIWFSTVSGFTASKWSGPTNRVSAGDLISDSGRVVRSNGQLLGKLGIMPGVGDFGVDAVDIGPGGGLPHSKTLRESGRFQRITRTIA